MKGIVIGFICLRKVFLCSIFLLAYLSSTKCAYREGSYIWYNENSTSDLAINEASTSSYESLASSSESLSARSESLSARNGSLSASSESLAAGSESLEASSESLEPSNESEDDLYDSEESVACQGELNNKTPMWDGLRDGISEDDVSGEDLSHVEEGFEEMLNAALKNNFQKDLSTSENSLYGDDQLSKIGFSNNCSETNLDSDMGDFKSGRSTHGFDIDMDTPKRSTDRDHAPQGEEEWMNVKADLQRQRNHQRNSVNIKLKNFYGEEKIYNVKRDSFMVKVINYLPFAPIVTLIIIVLALFCFKCLYCCLLVCSFAMIAAWKYRKRLNRKQFERVFGKKRRKLNRAEKRGGKISRFLKEGHRVLFDYLDLF
ncbi:hypothetical protein C922_02030 [Plasmodium inui San Antonio 1]|uniref:Uncharacterized protein n=1 Tax=Plasmodium inui San Antonio 1 TaxID=1237626 RepID=W7AQW5_9APIC|nr:hypothetical protein C922_02030 [Plasmodium inui San Antonio 1]EUD67841.1 hypothetical protein C922_02030 [Plasmodium inui San Antonio 1]